MYSIIQDVKNGGNERGRAEGLCGNYFVLNFSVNLKLLLKMC
jgi:hypothetical protein